MQMRYKKGLCLSWGAVDNPVTSIGGRQWAMIHVTTSPIWAEAYSKWESVSIETCTNCTLPKEGTWITSICQRALGRNPSGLMPSCMTVWKGTQWVHWLPICPACSGEIANSFHEGMFWWYRTWLSWAFYQDRLQSSTHTIHHATAVLSLQPMAWGDLNVTQYGQHSEEAGGSLPGVPGSYGKDGFTLHLGFNQHGVSPRPVLLRLHKSSHCKHWWGKRTSLKSCGLQSSAWRAEV